LQVLDRTIRLLEPQSSAAAFARCPICGPTLLVKLQHSAIGVRCVRCRGSAIHLSIAAVLADLLTETHRPSVYELSARGPLMKFFRREKVDLTCSEYFDDLPPGQWRGGVQCQDVQQLSYRDELFDFCTSTEVFEHVPDDGNGFREIRRVLKPGGRFVFTVPLAEEARTIERAKLEHGRIVHLLPPEYHGDRQRGFGSVLAFRNYGRDICERLREAGFAHAQIVAPPIKLWWGCGSSVIVAGKSK